MITGSIDVSKIDKSKLVEGKNGAKYLNIALIDTPNSEYGNSHMIVQSLPKEEREAGAKGEILGNTKDWSAGNDSAPAGGGGGSKKEDDLPW
jgi:hypothetical protein